MVMRLLCCLLLISATPLWAMTQLQASVDKNPVLAGEFFMLNISADDTIKNEQPDTSALLKDFVVGPTSVSTRTNIVNGSISKQTNWSIKLMTRTPGNYTIPAFSVSGIKSKPISLKVAKRSKDAQQNNDIFIKASLSSDSLFVQEAGLYTVKLYLAKDLLDGSLTAPTMPDAQLSQIGKQKEDYELVNGKRYLVITREYLLQPQKSGVFTIEGPAFEGRVRENYRQLAVSALGDNTEVEIKPIPKDYQGAWLPSELVNIDEQWQPDSDTVEVGTPITRTLTLTALGVTKEQLPDIELPEVDGIRSYPDEKDSNNLVRDGRVISQQTASYALLPQKPGTYTLPKVSVPWYNTKIKRISYATLPARTITVTPSSNAAAPTAKQPPQTTTPLTEQTTAPVKTVQVDSVPVWLIIVAACGYILWIITLILWFTHKGKTTAAPKAQSNSASAETTKISLDTLKAHSKNNDVASFHHALNTYAMQKTKQSSNAIDALTKAINDPQLSEQVAKLRASLYSSTPESVDLNVIINALAAYSRADKNKQTTVLKELY